MPYTVIQADMKAYSCIFPTLYHSFSVPLLLNAKYAIPALFMVFANISSLFFKQLLCIPCIDITTLFVLISLLMDNDLQI